MSHYNLQFKYTDNNHKEIQHIAAKTVCYPSSSGRGIDSWCIIIFSQILTSSSTTTTATAAAMEMTDIELEDKAIKQESEPMETEEVEDEQKEEDNTAKQQDEEEKEEEQESNDDDTAGTGLEEDSITIDGNNSSDDDDDDVPFDLPFDNMIPFP